MQLSLLMDRRARLLLDRLQFLDLLRERHTFYWLPDSDSPIVQVKAEVVFGHEHVSEYPGHVFLPRNVHWLDSRDALIWRFVGAQLILSVLMAG